MSDKCEHIWLADPRKAGTQYCRKCFTWTGDNAKLTALQSQLTKAEAEVEEKSGFLDEFIAGVSKEKIFASMGSSMEVGSLISRIKAMQNKG